MVGQVARECTPRVHTNEFASIDECRQAWVLAVAGYVMQHPDRFQKVRELVATGRNPFADLGK